MLSKSTVSINSYLKHTELSCIVSMAKAYSLKSQNNVKMLSKLISSSIRLVEQQSVLGTMYKAMLELKPAINVDEI